MASSTRGRARGAREGGRTRGARARGRLGRGGGGGRGGRPDKGKLFIGQFRKNSAIQIFTGDLGLSLSMRMFLHRELF